MDILETHFVYLQKTIDDLNLVVIEQQKEIREMRFFMDLLAKKVAALTLGSPEPVVDERPPHY
ncbi:MAG: SlyX family protein [Desulfovibrionales bacterium]|nr:SlyX family protein [Desulfovibrionales bacterium]